jgi:NAD(P) transhydrogenase
MSTIFDLIVIGSGPAGESGAEEAARLGHSVALIDDRSELGGNSCHTGTMPSKTLRESSLVLSHAVDHDFLPPVADHDEHPITMSAFMYRANQVMAKEAERVRSVMVRAGVTLFTGTAHFASAHTVNVNGGTEGASTLTGYHFLIACGSRPLRPKSVPFDGKQVFDSDDILSLSQLPKSLIVVGGGVIGSEYATIFSNLGMRVQLIDANPVHLPFIDQEIVAVLHREIAKRSLTLELGTALGNIALSGGQVIVTLGDGRALRADAVLYALGRTSNADGLDLAKAGVTADSRNRITVNPDYRTCVPHIAAAGDAIGFPSLAATSSDQGRSAVRELFGLAGTDAQKLLPFGIYTIPEISTVGLSEVEARASSTTVVVGRCRLSETARGIISGDDGLLKLIFDAGSRTLLGAHCIGARATDIIHTAMFCIRFHGTVDDLTDAVYNYPTVSDAIKIAALDALWQMEVKHPHSPLVPPMPAMSPVISCHFTERPVIESF